jgi:hypothetical protein
MENQISEWKSEAAALRTIGIALEEIDREALSAMGGRIGGMSDVPLEMGLLPNRMGYAKALILFDMDKLKKHLKRGEDKFIEAIRQGYGIDESSPF